MSDEKSPGVGEEGVKLRVYIILREEGRRKFQMRRTGISILEEEEEKGNERGMSFGKDGNIV